MIEGALFQLGYLGLAIGAFLEGEVIVILSGLLAHAGYMSLSLVIIISIFATFIGDQFFFYLGKHKTERIFSLFPRFAKRVDLAKEKIASHQNKIMATFRFLYGLRIATLIALGASGVSQKRFIIWNIFNSIAWSLVFSFGGYYFGTAFEAYFADFKHFEKQALVGFAIIISLVWVVSVIRSYINERKSK